MLTKEKELMLQKIIRDDTTIAEELEKAESISGVCEIFGSRGLTLSEDEASELMASAVVPEEGELDENALNNVAGGISWKQAKDSFLFGARVGIGARMLYDKYKYGNAQRTYSYSQLASGKFW